MDKLDIVLELCNSTLLKREKVEAPPLSAKELEELLFFAGKQGVLPMVMQQFAEAKMPDSETHIKIVDWSLKVELWKERFIQRVKRMRYMAKIFADEGIDVMFFKGATLSLLYPVPHWRMFSDIDFYLYGKSECGIKAMRQHKIENEEYYHHHTKASLKGVLLENHYDFFDRRNHKCNIILDDTLKMLAEKEGRSIKATFLDKDIKNAYVMTPTMNAIFLMRHMSAHFVSENIILRMLYDWILFLKRYAKEVDWTLVMGLYEASGMMEFVGIVQGLLVSHFALEFPECPVKPLLGKNTDKVWKSIANPSAHNPHKKKNLAFCFYEAKVFVNNRWKHRIVYPGESYTLLFIKYTIRDLTVYFKSLFHASHTSSPAKQITNSKKH